MTISDEWTGLEFGKSQRAVENREKWRKLVAKSSVVPQRPSRMIRRHDYTTAVCVSLRYQVYMWSDCPLDLDPDFPVGNMFFV